MKGSLVTGWLVRSNRVRALSLPSPSPLPLGVGFGAYGRAYSTGHCPPIDNALCRRFVAVAAAVAAASVTRDLYLYLQRALFARPNSTDSPFDRRCNGLSAREASDITFLAARQIAQSRFPPINREVTRIYNNLKRVLEFFRSQISHSGINKYFRILFTRARQRLSIVRRVEFHSSTPPPLERKLK